MHCQVGRGYSPLPLDVVQVICEAHDWVTANLGGVTFYSCIKCEKTIYKEKGWQTV